MFHIQTAQSLQWAVSAAPFRACRQCLGSSLGRPELLVPKDRQLAETTEQWRLLKSWMRQQHPIALSEQVLAHAFVETCLSGAHQSLCMQVVGRAHKGLPILEKLNEAAVDPDDLPVQPVSITACGLTDSEVSLAPALRLQMSSGDIVWHLIYVHANLTAAADTHT